MDYRLCHCLLNGLPVDQDVYDGVTWSSLVELTEQSVLKDGASVEVPDFTRGAWRTAQPLGVVDTEMPRLAEMWSAEAEFRVNVFVPGRKLKGRKIPLEVSNITTG